VPLLFAKYAREVAKALPSDQAYPLRGSEKRTARASYGLVLGLISGFGTNRRLESLHRSLTATDGPTLCIVAIRLLASLVQSSRSLLKRTIASSQSIQ
jgi:hypothetical protein